MGDKQAQSLEFCENRSAKSASKTQRKSAMNCMFCVLAFVLLALANNVLNTAVFPSVATYAPYSREVAILFGTTCFLAFYFLVTRKPQWLSAKALIVGSPGSIILGAVLLELVMPSHNIVLTILGLMFVRLGSVGAVILLALALVKLPTKRQMLLCAVWGMAAGEIIRVLIVIDSPIWGVAIEAACYIGIGLLLYRMAAPVMTDLSHIEAPIDAEVVNPESFLEPGNAVYLCVLVFNIALGFAMTLNTGAFNTLTLGITALVIFGVAVWLSWSGSADREDELFSFCVLIAVAGFLVAPFTFVSGATTANTLLGIGARIFELLIWLAVLSVGRRNILALLPSFVLLRAMSSVGTTIGAVAGHASTALMGEGTSLAAFITDVALFVFIVILWLGFRNFSFSKVIQGIVPTFTPAEMQLLSQPMQSVIQGVDQSVEQGSSQPIDRVSGQLAASKEQPESDAFSDTALPQRVDLIAQRCQELGKQYHLTPREIEIFELLARGRNGSFIMDHFVVSRNTAKSHIKHIYTKLGVHSQQELIDLVENGV